MKTRSNTLLTTKSARLYQAWMKAQDDYAEARQLVWPLEEAARKAQEQLDKTYGKRLEDAYERWSKA